jgi:hypothetical protein
MDVHLVVLHHGLWGSPIHLGNIENKIRAKISSLGKDAVVKVLNASSNSSLKTYDGIDICGQRLVAEIKKEHEKIKNNGDKLFRISLMGYSLGGLITRFAIGLLYSEGFFDAVEPHFYYTFASPHLGSNRPPTSFFNRFFNYMSSRVTFRTGRQLNLLDEYQDGIPLVCAMAHPQLEFYKGLALFKIRGLYANVRNDGSVPYTTASISVSNPYRKHAAYLAQERQSLVFRSFHINILITIYRTSRS